MLEEQFPGDIEAYCDGKDAFVKEMEKKSRGLGEGSVDAWHQNMEGAMTFSTDTAYMCIVMAKKLLYPWFFALMTEAVIYFTVLYV